MGKKKMNRPTWDEYMFGIMEEVSKRSTCNRGRVGCVITKDNRVLSTGYAGAPPGLPHCDDIGHIIESRFCKDKDLATHSHCIRTIHAELNAILFAAKHGISLNKATLYCTMTPCYNCAMAIISCGIKEVKVLNSYQSGNDSIEMFAITGIKYSQANEGELY